MAEADTEIEAASDQEPYRDDQRRVALGRAGARRVAGRSAQQRVVLRGRRDRRPADAVRSAADGKADPVRFLLGHDGVIIGIAVLTILSQLPTISGYEPTTGSNKVTQAINFFSKLDRVNL